MAVTKRCIRCHRKVRPDGTCSNPECVLYVPPEESTETTSESSTDEETTAKTSNEKSK